MSLTGPDAFVNGGPLLRTALAVRFCWELALWAGAGVAAYRLWPEPVGWLVAIVAVIVVIGLWSLLLAPKAPARLPEPARLTIETLLVAAVAAALWRSGLWLYALLVAAVWLVDIIVIRLASKP